ncbi:hypothetical protein ANCDUO_22383 [Ancylostoma duodenale]|uniref:Uncharacterized protein n=1 Tax=Ancylostoma duodenale TaxID=51022 RepID=A0A0C2CCG8_9BILA|nr:hypothetical protein ANCDUO_22383 [Ancylostoma duodenale]
MEPPPTRTVSVPAYFNRGYRPFYSSTDTNSNLYIPESQRVPLTLQAYLRRLLYRRVEVKP